MYQLYIWKTEANFEFIPWALYHNTDLPIIE